MKKFSTADTPSDSVAKMAVSIPSDIVLEVAQARRNDRYARVLEKLNSGSSDPATSFAAAISNVGTAPFVPVKHLPGTHFSGTSRTTESTTAFRKLEAQVVKHLVETMLPNSIAGGKAASTANGFWKSTLADTLAQKIADQGQIGLAARLESSFKLRQSSVTVAETPSAS